MPEHLAPIWSPLRLYVDGHASWSDLERMTIDDVDDAWEAIAAVNDARHEARRRAEDRR